MSNINKRITDPKVNKRITYKYPNDITNDEYKYRCLNILVLEQTKIGSTADELLKSVSMPSIFEKKSKTAEDPSIKSRKLINAEVVMGIALPLPNSIEDAQTHDWDIQESVISEGINSAGNSIMDYVGKLGGGGMASKVVNLVKNKGSKALGEASTKLGFRKPMVDPGYFANYVGTKPRTFAFAWDLVPNNEEEYKQILNIVHVFKKYGLPKSTINGISLMSPYIFEIVLANKDMNNLINMNNLVLTAMEVSYGADGAMEFLPNGAPKYMKLTLRFNEKTTMTADQYGIPE